MNNQEVLSFIKENFGPGVFATVEEDGNPRSRYAIIQDVVEGGIIFQTTRDKRFFKNLEANPVVAFSGMVDGPIAVNLQGKVEDLGEAGLDALIEANPSVADSFADEEARKNAAVFKIYDGQGTYMDLGKGEFVDFSF